MADYDPDRLLTERPSGTPMMTVRPRQLSRAELEQKVRKYNPDITNAAVQGEVDNIIRESGGKPGVPGDYKNGVPTSGSLYQHHNERLAGLKSYAAKHGVDWRDPDIAIQYARLEKERDYPALLKAQQTSDDRARMEDQFKRVFERPASVLWQHDAQGRPLFSNDQYQFSDYAMDEPKRRRGSELLYMTPREYLDLSPELEGKPFESPSGRSLMRSFNKGEPIEAVPSLDVKVDGPTATVTDQDGRHRALLAEQQGLEAIPVAVRGMDGAAPKEIVGMSGNIMAHDFPKVDGYKAPERQPRQPEPEQPREPVSLLGRVSNALFPSAQAAEAPDPFAKYAPAAENDPFAKYAGGQTQAGPEPAFGDYVKAGAMGAAKGLGDTMLAGQELVGKGMEAVGIPGGEWLTRDARQGMERLNQEIAPAKEAMPITTGIGDVLGGMAVPGAAGARLVRGGNTLAAMARQGAAQGALAGLLTPSGKDEGFWGDKATQTGLGAGAGASGGVVGAGASRMIAPNLRAPVEGLMREGVQLTPGQMAGGFWKAAEDKLMSIPVTGDAISAARRRAMEQYNIAAYNRALEPIGEKFSGTDVGFSGIQQVQDRLGAAYDRVLNGTQIALTNGYANDLRTLARKIQRDLTPDQVDAFLNFMERRVAPRFTGGTMDGPTFKQVESEITNQAFRYHRSGDWKERDFGDALDDLNAFMRKQFEDQNPGKRADLQAANRAFATFARLRKAAVQRPTNETGIFTPSDILRAAKSGDRTSGYRAFSTGNALMQDFGRMGQAVMGHNYPDSGTAGRYLMAELLGGGAVGGATGHLEHLMGLLAMQGAAAMPYTPPASRALNAAVERLSRPPGPTRNALANTAGGIGMMLPAALGGAVAGHPQTPQQ